MPRRLAVSLCKPAAISCAPPRCSIGGHSASTNAKDREESSVGGDTDSLGLRLCLHSGARQLGRLSLPWSSSSA